MRTIGFLLTTVLTTWVLAARVADEDCSWSAMKEGNPKVERPVESLDFGACNDGDGLIGDCDVTFKCDAGDGSGTSKGNPYFFKEDPEAKGIVASCRGGQWTFKGNYKHLKALPKCTPACPALTRADMVNATYVTGPPTEVYSVKGKDYWLFGAIVETKCKPGYTFTNTFFDARGKDKHECIVPDQGAAYWKDMVSGVANDKYGKPAVCMATCKPMDLRNLPSDVELTPGGNPENDENSYKVLENGKKVLVYGSGYTFKCKDGKNFTNPGYDKEQRIICNGGENGWYDPVTQKPSTKPATCSIPGCPPLTSSNLVPHANSEYDSVCKNNEGAMADGCEVVIKCAKTDGTSSGRGFYMNGKPNGHKLFCKNAKWVDESGAEVKPDSGNRYGGECVGGCAKLTDPQKGKTEVTSQPDTSYRNDDMEFVTVGSKMDTKCKDSYIRPSTSTQPAGTDSYQCTDNGWGNIDSSQTGNKHPANCVGACPVPPESTGTKYDIKGQVTVKNGVKYLQEGGSAEAVCEDKFTQPKGQPSNSQKLTCSGGNNGWMDGNSNKTGQSVLVCVKDGAAGCPIVNPTTNPNTVVTTEGDCTPSEGMLPENCKIAVTCKSGFIPETSTSVSGNGSQILQCKAGHDGYQDSTNGQKNVAPLKCIAGCELIKDMRTATYAKAPQTSDIIKYGDKEYLRKDAEVIIKCKEGFEFVHADDYNSRNPELKYLCKGGDEKYIKPFTGEYNKVPGDGCGGVCEALTQTLPGTEVTPFNSNSGVSFIKAGKRMIVGYQYTMKCRKGFEYPRNTLPAQKGYHKLGCLGGTDGYVDLESNVTNSKLIECIPIEEPSCPNLSISPSTENTEVVPTSGNCTIVGTKVPLGCSINLKCKEGFFRSTTTSMSPPSQQPLKCVVNNKGEAEWVGGNDNNPANLLKCTFGCPAFDESNGKIIIWTADNTINDQGIQYYAENKIVSVKCTNGYVSKHQDGSATDQDDLIEFKCTGGLAGRPWRNLRMARYEDSPANACAKFCPGLTDKKPEGVILKQGPFEKETTGGKIVTEGSFYDFDCMPGYKIDATNRPNNKSQTLVCNGKTGLYNDETNGNASTSEPLRCTKIIGEGCSAMFLDKTNVTKTNCGDGFPDKCKVEVKCANGHIPTDKTLYNNPTQEFTCVDGRDWKDSKGNVYTSSNVLKCTPACKYDSTTINENSKVVRDVSVVIVGGEKYVLQGTPIPVTCQGDTIIWVKDSTETTFEHEFVCRGGDQGYKTSSNVNNQVEVKLGDGCVTTCLPLRLNLSTSVVKGNDPRLHNFKGVDYIATDDTYLFKCAANYIYPAGSKPAVTGVETIKCDGKSGKYVNAVTGQEFVAPTECVRNPLLNDCPIIEQKSNTWEDKVENCQIVDGKFYNTGCKRKVWCQSEHKPVDPDYIYGAGEQILTCGSGGSGWKDQNGKVITSPLVCEKGCVPHDNLNSTYVHDSKTYYKGNISATCILYENSTSPGGRTSQYHCVLPPNSQGSNNCTNACVAPTTLPGLVVQDTNRQPIRLTPDNLAYVFGYEEFVYKCKGGYYYPRDSPNRQNGYQILTCNPITKQFDDILNNKKNAVIEGCEDANGCKQLPQGQNSGMPTEIQSCLKNDGWYTDKCKLKYSCMPGHYPSDKEYLYAGGQELTCDEKKEEWVRPDGQNSTKVLDCVKGCAPVDYEEIIRFLKKTHGEVIIMDIKDSEGKEHSCYTAKLKEEMMRIIERSYNIPNPYFCPGPKNDSTVVNRFEEKSELCMHTCKDLEETKLPEGTVLVKKPALLDPYNSQKYTGYGNSYEYACREGYEPTSPNTVKQVLKCQPDGTYINVATNVSTKTPTYIQCQKVSGCLPLTQSNADTVVYEANCGSPVGGVYKSPCTATISCKKDSYPIEPKYRRMLNQKLKCERNNQGWYWGDLVTGQYVNPFFGCTSGCVNISDVYSTNQGTTQDNFKISYFVNNVTKEVACAVDLSFKNANMTAGTHGYFCDTTLDQFESLGYVPKCTNACVLDKGSMDMKLVVDNDKWEYYRTLLPTASMKKMTDLVIPGSFTATLKCNINGFSVRLACDENLKLTEEKTGKPAGGKYLQNCLG